VVLLKKKRKFKICADFKKLSSTTKKNPFPLPFIDEILNIMVGCEAYSFLDGYFGYHQIFVTLENRLKNNVYHRLGNIYLDVMHFEMKNGPPTFKVLSQKHLENI
jgi:hypothetical protein